MTKSLSDYGITLAEVEELAHGTVTGEDTFDLAVSLLAKLNIEPWSIDAKAKAMEGTKTPEEIHQYLRKEYIRMGYGDCDAIDGGSKAVG